MFNKFHIETQRYIQGTEACLFLKRYHYLPSLPRGCNKIYCLYIDNKLSGVAAIGEPISNKAKEKYNISLELKRFCLIPGLPKNTASWFMSKIMKDLKGKGHNGLISYADPSQGHSGTIYKASNFIYLGTQSYKTSYIMVDNKKIYSRNIYNKNHSYNPTIHKLKYEQPKHIYRMEL